VSATGLDLSSRGIALRFPGSALELESFSARTQCIPAPGFTPEQWVLEPVVAVDRSYRSSDDDEWLWLSQYPSPQRTVDALYPYGATFWIDGTTYVFWAWSPWPGPLAGDSGSSTEDPTARLVEEVLADLAPELDPACFYRQTSGGFEDLAALGIGDPRPALPPGYDESWVYLQYFTSPPAACGALAVDMPVYFGASFNSPNGYYGVWAQSRSGGYAGLGTLLDYHVWWLGERYQYGVYGWDASGPARTDDVLRIATTVDPELDAGCLRRRRDLRASDLERLGLPAATAPAGFTVRSEHFIADLVPESCTSLDPIASRSFYLSWYFEDPDPRRSIFASASRDPLYLVRGWAEPWVSEGYIWWQTDDGTWFHVSGYGAEGAPLPLELLAQVARSLDPGFELP
jgi:hypothetical protein